MLTTLPTNTTTTAPTTSTGTNPLNGGTTTTPVTTSPAINPMSLLLGMMGGGNLGGTTGQTPDFSLQMLLLQLILQLLQQIQAPTGEAAKPAPTTPTPTPTGTGTTAPTTGNGAPTGTTAPATGTGTTAPATGTTAPTAAPTPAPAPAPAPAPTGTTAPTTGNGAPTGTTTPTTGNGAPTGTTTPTTGNGAPTGTTTPTTGNGAPTGTTTPTTGNGAPTGTTTPTPTSPEVILPPPLAAAPAGGKATGTEDQPLALKWADFNINVANGDGLKVKTLPADGTLQVQDGTTWKPVAANQVISKADIDAGKLRFVPDANESGVDGYAEGVGNRKSDYARISFAVTNNQNEVSQTGQMNIDIKPIADAKHTISATMHSNTTPPTGHTQWEWLTPDGKVTNSADKTASYGTWQLATFTSQNTSPDKDGSERAMISFTVNNYDRPDWGKQYEVVTLTDGTVLKPDDKGNYLIPADTKQVHIFRAWGQTPIGNVASHQTVTATALTQELDAAGKVVDQLKGNTVQTATNTPITLDLDGNGIQTVSSENGVKFDYSGTGNAMQGGWVGKGDGLLALDLDKSGTIDSGRELFGDGTKLADGSTAIDGYQALSQYDGNKDGKIDKRDAIFNDLKVWIDADSDGVTDKGELKNLHQMGITSLNVNAEKTDIQQNGNTIGLMSDYTTRDGKKHDMGDVWFGTNVNTDNKTTVTNQ